MDTDNPGNRKTSFWQRISLVIFGLFLTLILIETGLRLGGFIILSLQELRNRASLRQKGAYRILCLGESTTQNQYPVFLEEALNQSNISITFSVIDKGTVGTNTSVILHKLESNLNAHNPDMVITMMGINDVGAHMPYEPVSDSKAINFLKSFRIYKLTRLLWLHIVTRLKELSSHDATPPKLLQKTPLQKAYVEDEASSPSKQLLKFKKAIELNPTNDGVYIQLGSFYEDQGRLSDAEESFKKAIELNPKNDWAYVGLGRLYRDQDKFSDAEESFKKAIELNPKNDEAYVGLVWLYRDQSKFSEAKESFRKAVEINPKNDWAYVGLGWFYRDQDKFSEAEASFKKAIEINPKNDAAYAALEVLYIEMGEMELARKYGKEARDLRLNYGFLITAANYQKLKAILDERGITYVCVQYPMCNAEPLKKIFQGNDKGIIFVDNEEVFKDEVTKHGRQNVFRDMFGGDFGHCTEKGNKLLAQNIAKVILKEVFGK